MVQIVPQRGNIFGRIGAGIGQGLAEQLPKEIERGRLAQGLQQFEQESANLNPMQSLARLAAIPGITPQMIQSFGELARQQGVKNAYENAGKKQERLPQMQKNIAQGIKDQRFGNFPENRLSKSSETKNIVQPFETGQPQVIDTNPLRPEAIPQGSWTPERRNEERKVVGREFPWMTPDQINEMVADNEARERAQPEAEQQRDTYKKEKNEEIKNEFKKRLELLTQKEGQEIYKDISGETLNDFYRTVAADIASNPKLTVEDAVNQRAIQLFQVPELKTKLNTLSGRDIFDKINPLKKKEILKSVISAGETISKVGSPSLSKEYYNFLKTRNDPNAGTKGFGLSPGRAAFAAYPRSKQINNFAKTIKGKIGQNPIRNAQYYASQVGKLITPEDSILSIMTDLSDRDPYFDKDAFIDYLRDRKDELGLTPLQQGEFVEARDYFPNWGDMALFPITSGGLF